MLLLSSWTLVKAMISLSFDKKWVPLHSCTVNLFKYVSLNKTYKETFDG